MKKVNEMITKVLNTEDGKCVDVFAYVEDETYGEVTLGYELNGKDEVITMCYGRINTEDPGDVPSKEFADRAEAAESEYGEAFGEMFAVAEKEAAK